MAADAAPLAPRELGRWAWRQLTSMRTALILLFLLAVAAVPGSVIPQDAVDSLAAARWREQHAALTPIYERLGLFSVYTSVWFSAIYILLMVSLVGCILPRCRVYWKALRQAPPPPPRNFARLPEQRIFETSASADEVLARGATALRGYQLVPYEGAVSGERGKLREAGNLLFHVCVVIVLVGFAVGGLFGFKGGVLVVSGQSFSNVLTQYDDFAPGSLFDPSGLEPFSFTLDDFDVTFITKGREAGMAHKFTAGLDWQRGLGSRSHHYQLSVNHPLDVHGTKVYLIGHGYAPHITVRNADGSVAFSGPVIFLPEDETFRSFGVVKVADVSRGKDQLGFEGELYPTYAFSDATGPFSAYPDAKDPFVSMLAYRGDLGLDSGVPQSVYSLQKKGLEPIRKADGKPLRVDLPMGRTQKLPDGLGSITFDGVDRFVKLQISRTPADWVALLGMSLALLGLLASLYVRPRRIWVRAREVGGRTLVEVAGLDRSARSDLGGELDRVAELLRKDPS